MAFGRWPIIGTGWPSGCFDVSFGVMPRDAANPTKAVAVTASNKTPQKIECHRGKVSLRSPFETSNILKILMGLFYAGDDAMKAGHKPH